MASVDIYSVTSVLLMKSSNIGYQSAITRCLRLKNEKSTAQMFVSADRFLC